MKEKTDTMQQSIRLFPILENQCVWMKAGVVNFKLCENAYDCTSCPFDKAMSRKVSRKPTVLVSWREVMRSKPFPKRECRHMLTGRVQYKFCANNYQCSICEFDQNLDEMDLSTTASPINTRKISGFALADNYYYHPGHGWARIEHGGFVRLGMDDFTLRLLGRPTNFNLPKIGSHLEQSKAGWSIQRQDKKATMLAPMKGVVLATNQKALKDPDLVRKDPYGQGWLMVIEPRGLKKNLKSLLFEKETTAWLNAEARRLEEMVTAAYGIPLASTGGEIVDDIFGNLTHLKWNDLVREFLLT
jgi:glycine cleavage system H lipoate-binding protein